MSEIRPTDPHRPAPSGLHRGSASGPASWFRPGQILEGRVISTPEGARLRVGEITLPLRGDVRPAPGSRLLLEVIQVRPALDMRILEQSGQSQSNRPNPDRLALARETLAREGLARQLDSRNLLQSLRLIIQPSAGEINRPPEALRQALAPLLTAMRSVNELSSANGVRQALRDSGLFAENRLMLNPNTPSIPTTGGFGGHDPLARDWKIALGRSLLNLRETVRAGRLPPPSPPNSGNPATLRAGAVPPPPGNGWNSAPPGNSPLLQSPVAGQQGQLLQSLPEALRIIIRQIEGALGRSELQQAASQSGDSEGGRTQLWFEVPVQRQDGSDLWQFYLQREEQASKRNGEDAWTATLAVHLAELGPFYAELRLQGERLSVLLYAETGETIEKLRRHLGEFRQRLRAQQLRLDRIGVSAGSPPPGLTALPMRAWRSEA
ncbi:hypothetical protein J2T60_000430 [Natronospira proteinivora]|uniref:Flagellar hook-length control protein-like C-terminal domain-containing protein n=1 Tax=Natronospira proteinivora TaxID=1807133 RepID=A0ABT1G5A6_9GAMM|nr:flagellar hook-length control protein FliK [Natronospira proteinivora]MCP1726465.1 hypothetical protein [Natronospira proteinivora]